MMTAGQSSLLKLFIKEKGTCPSKRKTRAKYKDVPTSTASPNAKTRCLNLFLRLNINRTTNRLLKII